MSIWSESLPGDIWLVGVSGRLDHTQTNELELTLQELVDQGHTKLVINLSEATYINSSGLRCLVTLWRQTRHVGGNLTLCGLNERLKEVFSIVGFDKVFDIFDDCLAAQTDLVED